MGERLQKAVDIAVAAGELLSGYYRQVSGELKANQTLVTEADRASERQIRAALQREFPGENIVGEEYGLTGAYGSDRYWFIDPIDGTNNFVNGIPMWCVAIGFMEGGEAQLGVIHHPLVGDTYHGAVGEGAWRNDTPLKPWQGNGPFQSLDLVIFPIERMFDNVDFGAEVRIRALGSAQLHFAYVAAGSVRCGFWHRNYAWDLIAGTALCRAAGIEVTCFDGTQPDLTVLIDGSVQPWGLCAAPPDTMPRVRTVLAEAGLS